MYKGELLLSVLKRGDSRQPRIFKNPVKKRGIISTASVIYLFLSYTFVWVCSSLYCRAESSTFRCPSGNKLNRSQKGPSLIIRQSGSVRLESPDSTKPLTPNK